MGERTVRRKLQKRKKRRPYGRCPKCGTRIERRVLAEAYGGYSGPPEAMAMTQEACDMEETKASEEPYMHSDEGGAHENRG